MCVFKAKYRFDKALNIKHLAYIQKEGKGLYGTRPELYGADPENYEKRVGHLHFRFIISPENQNVDIRTLTEEVMKQLEFRTGRKLDWVAADHYNTGLKHSHILINSYDLDGKKFRFDPSEIKSVIRESCRDICTSMAGNRTPQERLISYQNQVSKNSYTQLDRMLDQYVEQGQKITLFNIGRLNQSTLLHKRLLHLKELGLVSLDNRTEEFVFSSDWKTHLKTYGKYNTFLEGLDYLKCHPSRYSLHDIDTLGRIKGRVVRRYFMQEDSNNHAVILETKPGHYSYIPLFEAPVNAPVGSSVHIDFQQLSTPTGGLKKTMNITRIN
jgi:hypothetical protein